MVEQLSSLCHCFGFQSLAIAERDAKKEADDKKKLPLKKRRSYMHHKTSFSNDLYGIPHIELYENQESLLSTYKRHKWIKDKDSSIIILGATLSGIHFASILKRHGFSNITILEKTYSMNISKIFSQLFIHSNSMKATLELIELYGDNKINKLIDSNKKCSIIINENTQIKDINEWMFNGENNENIINAIKKYIKIHEFIFGENETSQQFPAKQPTNITQINITFMRFIEKYDLEILVPYFMYNQVLLNGFATDLDDIPAFYGLLWNNVTSMRKLLDAIKQNKRDKLWMLNKDFGDLFENIVKIENINIKYGAQITSINRYLNDEKHKICLMYNEDEYEKLIECDVLFSATNTSSILPNISDITKEEEFAFGNFVSHTLCLTKFEYKYKEQDIDNKSESETDDEEESNESMDDEKGLLKISNLAPRSMSQEINISSTPKLFSQIRDKGYTFYPENITNVVDDGHIFKLANITEINGDSKNKKKNNDQDDEYKIIQFIGYQMMNQEINSCHQKQFEKILIKDLKKIGLNLENVKIMKQEMMRFSPRWSQSDINEGIPWLVKDKLQGKYKNMYYIGNSVCFQSVESILKYNIQLQHQLHLS